MVNRKKQRKTADAGTVRYQRKTAGAGTVKYFDYSLLFIVIFLVLFGMVMLYSVSAYEGQDVFNDPMHYLKRQAFCAIGGFVFMVFLTFFPLEYLKKLGFFAYGVALLSCLAVIAVGKGSHGSTRWLKVGPIQLQPSEFAKIAVIVFMAALLSRIPKQVKDMWSIIRILISVLILAIVVAVSNLSTAIIIGGIAFIMTFVVSPKIKEFVILACVLAAGGAGGIAMGGYRVERVAAWLHPDQYPDKIYQTMQGMYAIGSGGLFGKGLGASVQKLGYVPEAQNDFIFTIICEELGLFGAICVILLFVLLLWRCMVIANSAPDLFSALLVVGVMAHIALQVVLNIMVVTNWMPNTGIILPFFSYGGSSILVVIAEMGLVLNVSRQIRFDANHPIE